MLKSKLFWLIVGCSVVCSAIITLSVNVYLLHKRNLVLEKAVDELVQADVDRRDKMEVLDHKFSVVDESLNAKDKRSSRIKQMREIIARTIKNKGYKNHLTPYDLTEAATAVVDYSEEYHVPKNLILAVMTRESAFNPHAVSPVGAIGMMQLMPPTAKEVAMDIGKRHYNIKAIKDNIQLGTYYLWKMLDRFEWNVELAIKAYNAGPVYVERVLGLQLKEYPQETREYHEAVSKFKREYELTGL